MQFRKNCCSVPRRKSHRLELPTALVSDTDGELKSMLLKRVLSSARNGRCAFEVCGDVILIGGGKRGGIESENLRGRDAEDALVLPPPRVLRDSVAADIFGLLQRVGMLLLLLRLRKLLVVVCARHRRGRGSSRRQELRSLHACDHSVRVILRAQRQRPQTPGLLLLRRRATTRLICPQRFLPVTTPTR